jgi:manganese/zinc/iron transport system substrate-binding protein
MKRFHKNFSLTLGGLGVLSLLFVISAQAETRKLPANYTIGTTCGMATDIVREVAGAKAQAIGLMGEGVDPHLYKPTRDDMAKLLQADVVIYSGLMREGYLTDSCFLKVARKGPPVFAVKEARQA